MNMKQLKTKTKKKTSKKSHTAQKSCHLLSNNKWTKERIRFMQCKLGSRLRARIHLLRKDYVSGESLRASFVRTKHTASSKNGVLGRAMGGGEARWQRSPEMIGASQEALSHRYRLAISNVLDRRLVPIPIWLAVFRLTGPRDCARCRLGSHFFFLAITIFFLSFRFFFFFGCRI